MGIFGIIGVVFLTLKLTEQIDWSWWFVLMPFYGALALLVVFFICFWSVALAALAVGVIKESFRENKGKS